MAIIRCISGDDGSLIPRAIEFERGDVVVFTSGDPGNSTDVRRAITADDLSQGTEQLTATLDVAIGSGIRIRPDPKLPTPPPEDGGAVSVTIIFGAGAKTVKVVVDEIA